MIYFITAPHSIEAIFIFRRCSSYSLPLRTEMWSRGFGLVSGLLQFGEIKFLKKGLYNGKIKLALGMRA
jgi:hypothetical protein